MIFIAIILFLLHTLQHEKKLISNALYNIFEGKKVPTPTPIFIPILIPVSRLCLDHPVKQMKTKEDILSWLLSNCPKSLPSVMKERFYLDSEWRVKYEPISLESLSLKQLKLANAFGVKPYGKQSSKASWIQPIREAEQLHLAGFLCWSDSLARSLKS